MKEVLSFGAGVQSTTLLLMSCEGILPKLDHVIFADTQWEPAAVYRHLEWCKEHAAKHGIAIDVRTVGNLRADLVASRELADGKRRASIPAFIRHADGSDGGMIRRQCTGTYKIEVIERYIREAVFGLRRGQRWPLEPAVRQWLGISRDEKQRMKISHRPAVVNWHPLIEAKEIQRVRPGRMFADGFDRADCLAWIKAHGYPEPARSACIGCPFRRNEEWRRLTADEFADACEVDVMIRMEGRVAALIGEPYLHRELVPLSEVDLGREDEHDGFGSECAGVCGV